MRAWQRKGAALTAFMEGETERVCTRQHGGGGGGETSDTDCPLLVRCGLMARATARLERSAWAGGATRLSCRTCVYVMQSRVYVNVRGEMFLSFGVQVQQLL